MTIIFAVSGCGTVPKKFKEEVSGIKTKVDTLQSRMESVESKQMEVERATSEHGQAIEDLKARKTRYERTNISVKPRGASSKARVKEIQTYLKNANFYDGKIDGIKGPATKRAIKEFQASHGLTADGRVGPKTWEALARYASGPAEAVAAGTEEGTAK